MDRIERIRERLIAAAPMHTPGEWYHKDIPYLLSELIHYKQMEQDGLLVRLPCKVGNAVYCDGKVFADHCKGDVKGVIIDRLVIATGSAGCDGGQ